MTPLATTTELWAQTIRSLEDEIDGESLAAWIEPIDVHEYANGKLTLGVPSEFFGNWIRSNYQEPIKRAFAEVSGCEVTIRYVVNSSELRPDDSESAQDGAVRRLVTAIGDAPTASTPLNSHYTFDSFIVGESNRYAYAAAQAVADPQSRAFNPLFFYGGVGLGKTHLMHAIGQQMRSYGDHLHVLYISSEAFMNAFIEGITKKNLTPFRNYVRNVDLLLIDDVQFLAGAQRTRMEFFHTFNALFDAGKKIVISSDHPPKELTELEERLRSRFEAGLIVDIQPPDLETRVAILLRKARDHDLELPQEVAIYVAERIRTNVRKLEGALKKLTAHQAISNEPLVIETCRRLLAPFFSGEEPLKISVEKIQLSVCKFFDISLHELTGSSRARKHSWPRQIAAYLTREMTEMSYPEIARKFGGRDHTSILHAHRKVRHDMGEDLNKQNLIKYLTKLIKEETFQSNAD